MGMYDSVIVACPACGTEEYFQSKSGDCILKEYPLKKCPIDVLYDVNRHSPYTCESCGLQFAVDLRTYPPKAVEYSTIAGEDMRVPTNGYQPIGGSSIPDTLPKGGSGISTTDNIDEYQIRCVKAINYIWQTCHNPDMVELMRILQGDHKEWFGDIVEPKR